MDDHPHRLASFGVISQLAGVGGVDDITITEAVCLYNDRPAQVDRVTLGRIERDRDELGRHLARTRDVATCQTGMALLDGEEQLAREPAQTGRLTPPEVVAYLRSHVSTGDASS